MCNIAGYAGHRQAAPILLEILRRQEPFDGNMSTGIATIHEGRLYYAKLTGDMERLHHGEWVDGNGFGEVMTILDWLCDSRADRYITGRWINIVDHGHYFHRNLQEESADPDAIIFDRHPEAFVTACEALKGEKLPGADIGYAIELIDGLRIFVQLWHGDEEFPPRLRFLWDENTTRYISYETTWYALGLLLERLRGQMKI